MWAAQARDEKITDLSSDRKGRYMLGHARVITRQSLRVDVVFVYLR